jgi:hypothetical protein
MAAPASWLLWALCEPGRLAVFCISGGVRLISGEVIATSFHAFLRALENRHGTNRLSFFPMRR